MASESIGFLSDTNLSLENDFAELKLVSDNLPLQLISSHNDLQFIIMCLQLSKQL